MKRRLTIWALILVMLIPMLAVPASAVPLFLKEIDNWMICQEPFEYVKGVSGYKGTAPEVTVPNNIGGHQISYIYTNTFEGNTTMKSLTVSDGLTVYSLSGCDVEKVKLGKNTKVLEGTFAGCKKLKEINIPSSWEEIKDGLFADCESLTKVVLPDTIKHIGFQSYAGCTGLTSITLPAKLETIDQQAFAYCTGLKTITIPKSVTYIAEDAFAYCTGLEKIVVETGNKYYSSDDKGNLYDTYEGKKTLVWAATKDIGDEFVIPEDVDAIGTAAFLLAEDLTSIVIPKNVKELGEYAFAGCVNLKEVLLEGGLNIGANAFANVAAVVYCPGDTGEWSESNVGNFGGALMWYAYCTGIHLGPEGTVVTESTCTVEGTAQTVCDLCGETYTYALPLLEHSYGEAKVVTESTCTVAGEGIYTCTVCGYEKTEALPLAEHEMSAPESDGSGYHRSHCANCSWSSMVICNFVQTEILVPPTCTELGKVSLVCTDCGYEKDGVLLELPHDFTDSPAISASKNTHTQTCKTCGNDVTQGCNMTYTQEPLTPTRLGRYIYHCDLCGNHREELIEEVFRICGKNRFETAFKIADQMKLSLGIEKFDAVIVASGTNFADALSGSYLAAVKNAPILLSFNDEYNQLAKNYIRANLNPGGTVYILGGTGAVPATMEEHLEDFTVKRLAGGNRFETNLAILEEAGVGDKPVLVCTGLSFADSLSASASELPILLVWNDLTEGQKALLEGLGGDNQLYVIGGEGAVSTDMEDQLAAYGSVKRIGGSNRFETSVMIAREFFEAPEAAVLAYAWDFPDGLCGGPLAAALDIPLILTMPDYSAEAEAYAREINIQGGTVLGGDPLIQTYVAIDIFKGK